MKKVILFICLIIVFFLTNSYLCAQGGRGRARISGKVTDESGKPIIKAKVTIEFLEREDVTRDTTTDKNGKWKIMGLGSGNWRITITAEGYIPLQDTIFVRQLDVNPALTHVLKKPEEQLITEGMGIELFDEASQLFKEDKFEESLAKYQEFLEKNPELYHVHFGIGNCYKELRDTEQALKHYQILLQKIDEQEEKDIKLKSKVLSAIGECYLQEDDLDSAQDYLKQSLELDPQDEILAYNVGEIYFSHQKMEEAIQYFTLASQIKPDWSDPFYKLGLVYVNMKDNDKALESFEKFLELEPDTERSASVKNIMDFLKK